MKRVAVIMTCHNRRDATLKCLQALQAQSSDAVAVELFATDDGSIDGTAEAIECLWPSAKVIEGNGSLYWAAGMALAERDAVNTQPGFLLWLNDDTVLEPDAVERLLGVATQHNGAIIVGATVDPLTGGLTYGGRLRPGKHPQRLAPLPLAESAQRADTFNGNVVLIPWVTRQRVGPIDGLFPHAYADDDYGLRATALGIPIIQAPGSIGACARNVSAAPGSRGLAGRWTHLQSPKGLPWKAQARFLRRHGGWRWPLWLVAGQARRMKGISG